MEVKTTVQMKRGGLIPCIARARVYKDCDGAGQEGLEIDDLQIFWPKKGAGKLYPIRESLIASTEKVEESLSEAFSAASREYD
jgi:hypothetical protein